MNDTFNCTNTQKHCQDVVIISRHPIFRHFDGISCKFPFTHLIDFNPSLKSPHHFRGNSCGQTTNTAQNTVDGRNPGPIDVVNIPLFTGFETYQLVLDVVHQQYFEQTD